MSSKAAEVLRKRGDFDYDKFGIPEFDLEITTAITVDDIAVYVGQMKNGKYWGRGKLMK